jgi:hypothetical protein
MGGLLVKFLIALGLMEYGDTLADIDPMDVFVIVVMVIVAIAGLIYIFRSLEQRY